MYIAIFLTLWEYKNLLIIDEIETLISTPNHLKISHDLRMYRGPKTSEIISNVTLIRYTC